MWFVGVLLFTSLSHAQGVWTYVDAQGVTHIGNASPPTGKHLQWLIFDKRVNKVSPNPLPPQLTRFAGYADVRPLLESAALRHDLDPALVAAVAAAESGFRPDAISPKGAIGLMQVMPSTAVRYGVSAPSPQQASALLKDPVLNVQVGARYLADLLRMFDGELELAVAAYNAGEGAVWRHGRRIPPYPETQQYVKRVMHLYRALTGQGG